MSTSGFKNSDGVDIIVANASWVPKSYLIDRYPELVDQYRFAGLWMWGYNVAGQLGTNDTINPNRSSPVQTVAGGTNWKQVICGANHCGAIKTDGTLWMWGDNFNGYLGTNDTTDRSSPIQTYTGGTNWKQVACGEGHTGVIKTDGTLWLWGRNLDGQLGTNNTTNRSSPVQTVTGGTNWKQVAGGANFTGAIKTDGTLWMWGYNNFGQLGTNDTTSRSSPVQTVTGGTNWKQVACGYFYSGAIKADGTLWMWGNNGNGQLGDSTRTDRSSPVQTVTGGTNWKQVACGEGHTGVIKTDGTLWMWGSNSSGQLGDNTRTDRSSPVQTVTGGTNWKQVSCGSIHTGAIKTDGTLWLWGNNGFGRLGTNNTTNYSSPVQTVAGGTNWKQVALGGSHSGAIKDDNDDIF